MDLDGRIMGSPKRTRIMQVRLTSDEIMELAKKAASYGASVSDLVRKMIFGKKIGYESAAKYAREEISDAINKIRSIGNTYRRGFLDNLAKMNFNTLEVAYAQPYYPRYSSYKRYK